MKTLHYRKLGPIAFYTLQEATLKKAILGKFGFLPFLQPPTRNPSKPYLGQIGFYPILFEIFSGGYFGLSGPLGDR